MYREKFNYSVSKAIQNISKKIARTRYVQHYDNKIKKKNPYLPYFRLKMTK